ncbi:MAG TPA: undecaprenyldiphospho-muramoylpentapeptide beta-N-acetylglucosaminyltransferase [Rhizomicrobium sp.]|jgi:UDP-N-acetylglucosamine--N-acetylmuramyl-(pentapeptide) pyrophosphoryl-undecaprenol N-acetylglucosamine transferase|nr:undecaprenyldiphospho-muramoylpentapeptide beta-N-acetylglucosaminyltransferase [Rhizomicrobium sp.]
MTSRNTIVLSTGGSGGHLFPAQALAQELVRRGKKIVVMTDARGTTYKTQFPEAQIEIVPAAAFSDRSKIRLMTAPFEIAAGIAVSLAKLRRIKPAAVVGFGGYPSVPVMLAAIMAKLPTAILAPDAVLGRANRLVANRVKTIAGGLPLVRFLPKDMSKVTYTGNPMRPEVLAQAAAPYETPLKDDPLHLLVFGGSQGARALSELVPHAVKLMPAELRERLNIVQQCRPEDLETVRLTYADSGVKAELAPFFTDLPVRMAKSHLVIGRSGAGTVSELAVIGRPAILIPLPHALDDNQTPNADALANAGGGWRVTQSTLTPQVMADMLTAAFSDPEDLARRAASALTLGKPDATQRFADLVEKLAGAAA